MKIGDKVKVLGCSEDINANNDFKDQIGTVIDISPDILLVTVEFQNKSIEAFWIEELELIKNHGGARA